jgi:uncharacterized membrane protein SpoIIM required for sporulation
MVEPDNIVEVPSLLIAVALGSEAVLALLTPLFGGGMGTWAAYFGCACLALLVSMRFLWSH